MDFAQLAEAVTLEATLTEWRRDRPTLNNPIFNPAPGMYVGVVVHEKPLTDEDRDRNDREALLLVTGRVACLRST